MWMASLHYMDFYVFLTSFSPNGVDNVFVLDVTHHGTTPGCCKNIYKEYYKPLLLLLLKSEIEMNIFSYASKEAMGTI